MRTKELPRLERMMITDPKQGARKRPRTPEEILAIVRHLNAMAGGRVIEKRKTDGR